MKVKKVYIFQAITVICLISLFKFTLAPAKVAGSSMDSTLNDGDIVLLNKWNVSIKTLKRFDVVIAKSDLLNEYVIKRIIGLPGEKIEYRNDQLYVNGEYVQEKFLDQSFALKQKQIYQSEYFTQNFEITLGEDEYLLVGDNRLNSYDSRRLGPFHRKDIIASKGVVLYPFSHMKEL